MASCARCLRSSAPLHLCALNESCLWEWLAQWDLMMRMSDKLESLLSEGLDGSDAATEGVYRNLALRYAAQLEECCQLLYGEHVTTELGIQSDGLSVERWSCGGQVCNPSLSARLGRECLLLLDTLRASS